MTSNKENCWVLKVVENIFNNWTALQLAVEHGMGGKNGHKAAFECMTYVYQFCIQNSQITAVELQELLEDIMDQEFNTICEDNSILEISFQIQKFLNLINEKNYDAIQIELDKLPSKSSWLGNNLAAAKPYRRESCSSSSDSNDNSMMDIGFPSENKHKCEDNLNWTIVRRK